MMAAAFLYSAYFLSGAAAAAGFLQARGPSCHPTNSVKN